MKELFHTKSFHLICSAERCRDITVGNRHKSTHDVFTLPPERNRAAHSIWEPVPDLAVASKLENVKNALSSINIISPNHEELAALYGFEYPASGIDKAALEA